MFNSILTKKYYYNDSFYTRSSCSGPARSNTFCERFRYDVRKTFYIIKNVDTDFIRGWRAHRIEQRWFYVVRGSFVLSATEIDDWSNTSRDLLIKDITLTENENKVLYIPNEYATAIRALEENSELIAFADFGITHAKNDDYTYPLDYFVHFKY